MIVFAEVNATALVVFAYCELIDAALYGLFYLALWVALPGGRKAMLVHEMFADAQAAGATSVDFEVRFDV